MNAAETSQEISDPYGGLAPDNRALGYLAWQLIGDWPQWVRRRVESISYETANSIRRRVSVDLRLIPELFGENIIEWGEQQIQYVPIAMLRKRRLVHFDLRDESGGALPLITMQRNAAITAAMLSAAAQSLVVDRWNAARSSEEIDAPTEVLLPEELEGAFWALAYLNPKDSELGTGALALYKQFESWEAREATPIEEWTWEQTEAGLRPEVQLEDWYALLGSDRNFANLAYDVALLFMVCVPLPYEPGRRRIVKFSYTEYLAEAVGPADAVKSKLTKWGLARPWNCFEDFLEGLPDDPSPHSDEWVPALDEDRPPRMKLIAKLCEVIGWRAQIGRVEAPAVSHGSSYHISIATPNGIQIRRAELVMRHSKGGAGSGAEESAENGAKRARESGPADGGSSGLAKRADDESGGRRAPPRPQRGNRTLRAVDLHVSNPLPNQTANVLLHIRPQSSLIVRAGFCCSALTAAALTLLWIFSPRITADKGAHTEAVAAALIVIPGLLSILATRDSEHPWATSMVFGVRVLVMTPGVLSVVAAGQVVAGDPHSWFGLVLFVVAWVIAGILGVGWRLAGRGQPDPSALRPREKRQVDVVG